MQHKLFLQSQVYLEYSLEGYSDHHLKSVPNLHHPVLVVALTAELATGRLHNSTAFQVHLCKVVNNKLLNNL